MDILVDTTLSFGLFTNNSTLTRESKQIIEDPLNKCYVSMASFWEIAIKNSLQRLELGADLKTIFDIIVNSGFEILPISLEHILKMATLEFFHADPFDRLIIAQAIVEEIAIVSKDQHFNKYLSN
jgi:PIN domain nuclease of toxin-antitoxin system